MCSHTLVITVLGGSWLADLELVGYIVSFRPA